MFRWGEDLVLCVTDKFNRTGYVIMFVQGNMILHLTFYNTCTIVNSNEKCGHFGLCYRIIGEESMMQRSECASVLRYTYISYMIMFIYASLPAEARSKAWVYGRSLVGIAGSTPQGA